MSSGMYRGKIDIQSFFFQKSALLTKLMISKWNYFKRTNYKVIHISLPQPTQKL